MFLLPPKSLDVRLPDITSTHLLERGIRTCAEGPRAAVDPERAVHTRDTTQQRQRLGQRGPRLWLDRFVQCTAVRAPINQPPSASRPPWTADNQDSITFITAAVPGGVTI